MLLAYSSWNFESWPCTISLKLQAITNWCNTTWKNQEESEAFCFELWSLRMPFRKLCLHFLESENEENKLDWNVQCHTWSWIKSLALLDLLWCQCQWQSIWGKLLTALCWKSGNTILCKDFLIFRSASNEQCCERVQNALRLFYYKMQQLGDQAKDYISSSVIKFLLTFVQQNCKNPSPSPVSPGPVSPKSFKSQIWRSKAKSLGF